MALLAELNLLAVCLMCSFHDKVLSIVNPRNFKALVLSIWVSILIFIGELGFDKTGHNLFWLSSKLMN
jgi:hypothetical protein